MTKLSLFVISLSFFLTACSGSDSDSSSSNGGNGSSGSEIKYVAGNFKNSADTEFYAPDGNDCSIKNSYYFESENVMVFGSNDYPETDYKYAATLVENNFGTALSKMGFSKEDFYNARPYYTASVANRVIRFFSDDVYLNDREKPLNLGEFNLNLPFVTPSDWDSNERGRYKHIRAYWNSLSTSEKYIFTVETIDIYKKTLLVELSDEELKQEALGFGSIKAPRKVFVCLSNRYTVGGEGNVLGMNLPAKSSRTEDEDENKVVLHELIHTIQHNFAAPVFDAGSMMDNWFLEGQATYLAGQSVASKTEGYNTPDVVRHSDENSIFDSSAKRYDQYALAYSYLEKNKASASSMKNMLMDIRTYTGGSDNALDVSPMVSSEVFEYAFDKNMPLTLQEYKGNYHSLLAR